MWQSPKRFYSLGVLGCSTDETPLPQCVQINLLHITPQTRYPSATKVTPAMTLKAIYPVKPRMFPDCSIIKDSLEKVENVVKPPQSPTVRNKAHLLLSLALRLKYPHKSPIRKQPNRFTARVAQGNPLPTLFIVKETRYLAAPPMKLPAPTTTIFLMMSDTIEIYFIGTKILTFWGISHR